MQNLKTIIVDGRGLGWVEAMEQWDRHFKLRIKITNSVRKEEGGGEMGGGGGVQTKL